ncbi:MAG: hypothetical protein NZZ41_02130 [Candidatus Dojkabacteria bacterium]|nr:hypothetical protein [Candidatus Dojkabacteria bacterium]
MPINTLSKFGVPVEQAQGGTKVGILQPKPKHRFRVLVTNFGPRNAQYELTRQTQSISRPSIEYPPVEVHSYNSRAYYAGKHSWNEVQLTVRDDISNRVTRLVGFQIQKQLNHFEQTGYPAGSNYKFSTRIQILDGGNSKMLEEWFLEGCFLSRVEYDTMEYSSSEPTMITMTIRYDNAQYWGEDGFEVLMPNAPLNFNDQLIGIETTPLNPRTSNLV